MNYIEIEKDILNSIMEAFNNSLKIVSGKEVPTIISRSNVPERGTTYCAIDVLSKGKFGQPDKSNKLNKDYETEYTLHRTMDIQLKIVGDDSYAISGALETAIEGDHRVMDEIRSRRLGLMRVSEARRTPQLRDSTEWVDGWSIDVSLTVAINVKYEYNWIEYITLNGELLKIPYN